MMDSLAVYAPALPEIFLSLGAMALLMLGAFQLETDHRGIGNGWLAIIILIIAAVFAGLQDAPRATLFDGSFVIDGFSRFFKVLMFLGSAAALVLCLGAPARASWLRFEVPVLVLLAATGMAMMVSANDLIALYLGLELMSLALYVLAAIRRDDVRSSEAGLKYFVLGALSSCMLLYGASMIYGFAGTTSFETLAAFVQDGSAANNLGLIVGMVFVLVGLAFKISAVPFHMWTPDVYEGAPTPITAFFAAAPKLAAMGLLTRLLYDAVPGLTAQWQQIIIFLSIASMLLGALAAIGQTNIKRLLAYSSIGHVGFALVGLAAGSEEGVTSVLVYLAIYLVMTLGSFACVMAMRRGEEPVEDISALAGLAKTNLPLAFAYAALLFSLAGIPPLAGFFAKFYGFGAAVKAGLYPLAVIGVIASVIGAYYYLRIVKLMFFDEPDGVLAMPDEHVGVVIATSAILVLGFVLYPSLLVDTASAAAKTLLP